MSFESVATIGQGVVIRESGIPGGGKGLWTARAFCKNDLITEYCGPIIDHKKALKLRKTGRHTHVRVLNSQWLYIDGLKVPTTGQGGASFANDARDSAINNACFVQRFDRKLGRDRVFLKAVRDLQPLEEVFVSYGNTYWQNSKKSAKSVLCHQEACQQPEQRRSPRQQQRLQQQTEQQLHAVKDPVCSKHGQSRLKRQSQRQQSSQQSSHCNETQQQQQHSRPLRMHEIVEQGRQAQLELHEIARAKKAQQLQEVPADSQESASSQVGWRRSERVRSRTDHEHQQQRVPSSDESTGAVVAGPGPHVAWGARRKRSQVSIPKRSLLDKQHNSRSLKAVVGSSNTRFESAVGDGVNQLQRFAAVVGKPVHMMATEVQNIVAAAGAEFRRRATCVRR